MPKERSRDIDVLSIGETLVDLISVEPVARVDDAEGFGRYLGGSVTNMALNVVRLGGRAAVVSRLGDDPFGRFLRHEMARQGLITDYVRTDTDRHTSMAFITRGAGTADFFICRGSDRYLSDADLPKEVIERSRAVHTSAFALSCEPARSAILNALEHARAMGCTVSLDPNYHPDIWTETDDVDEVLAEAFRFVDVAKPSRDDCLRLFGPACSLARCIDRFFEWGAKVVALTMGAQGVILARQDGSLFRITPNEMVAVDATGAGDAFWAGLLVGLLDGHPPEKAACLAQLVAEAKLTQVGPLPPVVRRDTFYREMDKVRCEPIAAV